MNIKRMPTPNRDDWEIPVEYLVLHYTAVDLQETCDIFMRPDGIVSAHIVIDIDGSVYELVDCLDGKALRGRHAGPSIWTEDGKKWEKFNDFSIGIELVNYNGNIFSYPQAQYDALFSVIKKLQTHYPALNSPNRILGHEHIAGFRGKADPGLCFEWRELFAACFENCSLPVRKPVCPPGLHSALTAFKKFEPMDKNKQSAYWKSVSSITESVVRLIYASDYTDKLTES